MVYVKTALFTLVQLFLFISFTLSYSQEHLKKQPVLILGCENKIPDKKWKDYRLSFGVNDLVAQKIYDSGLFSLIEEKDLIREKCEKIRTALWTKGNTDLLSKDQAFDTLTVIICKLLYCGAPRTNVSFGPVHANRNDIIVKVAVDLIRKGSPVLTGLGQGSASRTSVSTLFEYRDKQVLFDQTAIGIATKNAIDQAVNELCTIYKKESAR